jgi:hypothetical protein
MMGILGILVALGLLIYLAFHGISVLILAPTMALVAVSIDGGLPLLGSYTQIFICAVQATSLSFFFPCLCSAPSSVS